MNPLANLQPVNLAGTAQNALLQGLQVGDAMRQRKDAEARKQATTAFYQAKIGGDAGQIQAATSAMASYDPKAVYEMQLGEKKTDTIRRAAKGDPVAKLEMWGVDPELAMRLDKFQVEKTAEGLDFVSNAAFQIIKLPPEQRPQAWEQYLQQGIQLGFDGLGQYQGKYSDQSLNAIVAKAGQMKEFQNFQQPNYSAVGENGLQGFQYGVPIANGAIAPQSTAQEPAAAPKVINGATYYPLPGGKWTTDKPGGSVGNGTVGFPQ